jgi:Flp pilus assembly protein TadG
VSKSKGFRSEDGAAAVEFALILSLLLVIVFGIIEFGRTYSEYQVFVGAAREGARTGAVGATDADITSAVDGASQGYTLSEPITITVNGASAEDPPCNQDTVGDTVEVSWDQTFDISIPLLPAWSPSVHIEGVFRCE